MMVAVKKKTQFKSIEWSVFEYKEQKRTVAIQLERKKENKTQR